MQTKSELKSSLGMPFLNSIKAKINYGLFGFWVQGIS